MSIHVQYQNMTVKNIVKNKEMLRFDLHIQRNLVWTDDQKSMFIHSLLYGYPFPPCYAQDNGDGYLWILDGKQRLSTVIDFVENKIVLSPNTPEIDGRDVTMHIFDALPEDLQEKLLDAQFTIFQVRNMNEDERDDLFERLNSGTSLSRQEISRVRGGMEVLEFLDRLKNIPFISEKVNITSKQRNRYIDEELVLQIVYLYLNGRNIKGFDKKTLENFIIDLRENPITKEQEDLFVSVANYLDQVFKQGDTPEADKEREKDRKKMLKRVHVPTLFMMGIQAFKSNTEPSEFYNWAKGFLIDNYDSHETYQDAARAGSSKGEKIRVRLSSMEMSFNKYFNKQLV